MVESHGIYIVRCTIRNRRREREGKRKERSGNWRRYVGHLDNSPVHAFGEFTEILEGDGFFCVVHDGCFPDARGKLCSETRERLRSIHLWKSQRGHVTDNLAINKESKKGYLSADDTMTSPKRIDTTGHTFRTKTAVSR